METAALYQVGVFGPAVTPTGLGPLSLRVRAPNALPPAAWRASVPSVVGTDGLLRARLAAGDDQALAEAFDWLASAVYRAAVRVLGDGVAAQDVVQEVFVELWSHPDRYDPDAGPLRTYLVVMARHRAVDLVRSELRRVARQERHYRLTPQEGQAAPGDGLMSQEVAGAVRAAVSLLPDSQRRVVELAYFDGLSYREVAAAAGIPEGTAKSRLRLALAKLEQILDRQLLEQS
ncbi:MAG TPA: sigma-70 family RNA polymerase sigma factor [Streptosporangiaceae bacterium]|nr:sigma-70 family RNA polymerase sigma factor [Streptosporangiaceae bacterium]